jgi:hypothetical protein
VEKKKARNAHTFGCSSPTAAPEDGIFHDSLLEGVGFMERLYYFGQLERSKQEGASGMESSLLLQQHNNKKTRKNKRSTSSSRATVSQLSREVREYRQTECMKS